MIKCEITYFILSKQHQSNSMGLAKNYGGEGRKACMMPLLQP